MFEIKTGDDGATRARVRGELSEQRCEEAAEVLFILVSKVKEKID